MLMADDHDQYMEVMAETRRERRDLASSILRDALANPDCRRMLWDALRQGSATITSSVQQDYYVCGSCGVDFTDKPPHCIGCSESAFWRGPFKRQVERKETTFIEREETTCILKYLDNEAVRLADGTWELRVLQPNVSGRVYAVMGDHATEAEAQEWIDRCFRRAAAGLPEKAKLPDLAELPS
jgi:hypothetical protein